MCSIYYLRHLRRMSPRVLPTQQPRISACALCLLSHYLNCRLRQRLKSFVGGGGVAGDGEMQKKPWWDK